MNRIRIPATDDTPTWRTATVVALCESIRQDSDYAGGCPILADALQDADFSHEDLLAILRNPKATLVEQEIIVAFVYSAKTEAAVRWLTDFADQCGKTCVTNYTGTNSQWEDITLETVVSAGHDYLDNDEYFIQIGQENARDMMYEDGGQEAYWNNWALVTNLSTPRHDNEAFSGSAPFGCSC